MPSVRDLLNRFRPAGAPGAATAVGVPGDRRDSVVAELEPVFAHLADVVRHCDELRREAAAAAADREAAAAERGRVIAASARADSAADRASTAATLRAEAADAARRALARAEGEARQVRHDGDARRVGLVARAIDLVRAELRTFGSDGAGSS